jgi:hypothetical protein
MKIVHFACFLFSMSCASQLHAQTPAAVKGAPPASAEPMIADIHPSPYRPRIIEQTPTDN